MNGEDLIRNAIKGKSYPNDMVDGVIIKKGKEEEVKKAPKKPKKKRARKFPNTIAKWIIADFVTFTRRIFESRYGKPWGLNFSAQCNEVLKIKDSLSDMFGFCDNAILKEYIEWFFKRKSDFFVEKAGEFYFSFLCRDKILKAFYAEYKFDHPERYNDEEEYDSITIDAVDTESNDEFSDIENTFLLSSEDFVSRYGVIIAINWLMIKRFFSIKESMHYVYLACNKIYDKGMFDNVVKSTVKYSPYPGRLTFLDADRIAKKVDPSLSINVEVTMDARADLPV
jgi:hypothetical protein